MSRTSTKKQNIISLMIIVAGVILSFVIFGPNKNNGKDEVTNYNFATKVETMIMGEENSKTVEIFKTAIFEAVDSAEAVAEQAGRIISVNFEVGQQVQRGQILATFDQSDLINSAKVALEDSLNNLSLAEDNLSKTKKSVDESLEIAKNSRQIDELKLEQAESGGNQDEIDLAEKSLENSEDAEDKAEQDTEILINNSKIQVAQTRATVRQNQIAYEKSVIRAPLSGIVTFRNVDRYDYIAVGTEIAEISGASQLKAKIFLNNFEINKISEGDSVGIVISEKNYLGKVSSLSIVANSNNNRYEAQIESLEDISMEANRAAQIRISLNLNHSDKGTFFVPLSAISIGQQKNTVFVENNGRARLVEVEIGKTIGSQIEIISGLEKGDKLIVKNNRGLRDEEVIEIQQ